MSVVAAAKLLAVSTVFTVTDVDAALAFYCDRMGFTVQWRDRTPAAYAIVFRGPISLHLQAASRSAQALAACGKSALYVWVDDVAFLRDEIVRAGCAIAVPLCDTPYGTREFAVRDLDGNALSFAQNVSG
jgi:catechol 2,3-dioxygenase-like lactoylglutathione lyase family enzyme